MYNVVIYFNDNGIFLMKHLTNSNYFYISFNQNYNIL